MRDISGRSRLVPVWAFAIAVLATGSVVLDALAPTGALAEPASVAGRVTPAPTVKVVGNHLVDAAGKVVRLLGVNRSGTEYACIQGWGIFDGPSDAASVSAMASWHVNAVRLPLNEDCWLGINGVPAKYGGIAYRTAVAGYVKELQAAGIIAILTLQFNAPGAQSATGQQVMADASHSPSFWASVATSFKQDHRVVFDLYSEPHDISWTCWLKGCIGPGGWAVAGMQSLVNAVRHTGATQPIMAGGLGWANDLSNWLKYRPVDPARQLVASIHIYNFTTCSNATCWASKIAPVARSVPVVAGEIGENDCAHQFIDTLMAWADHNGVSYLGWTWDAGGGWTCTGGPTLITDYAGTPTTYGAGLKAHLAAVDHATG